MSHTIRWSLLAALLASASACGGDNGAGDRPDAGDTPTADADLDAPDGDGTGADAGPEDTATVFALGASGDVGIVSTVGIPSLEVTPNVVEGVADSDAVVRRIGDEIYILNRSQDNVTILNEDLELVNQFSMGGHRNPHDVAVRGDSIYVTAYDSAGVVVLDATDPEADVQLIDLSSIDDGDDIPDCSAMHLAGDTLLVACQRLTRDPDDPSVPAGPRGVGVIAVIDTETDTLETTFELAAENPFSRFAATDTGGSLGGDLLIASVADFAPANGCIERVTLDPEPASEGCFIEGSDIGGYVSRLEVEGDVLWLVATRADFSSFVASYDLGTDELSGSMTPAEQSPTDFAICPDGEIVVADNEFGGARGLRVFADGDELTEDLLDIAADPAFANGLICY